MATDVVVVWDSAALRAWAEHGLAPVAAMDRLASAAVNVMKALIPVSPTMRVYATPVPLGRSVAAAGFTRIRYGGDLPLRPSGYLRNSVVKVRDDADGSVTIGPTAPYAVYVNDGTLAHGIDSTGPWPLRNRATGQVFGPHVNHPGTTGAHFIEKTAEALNGMVVRV